MTLKKENDLREINRKMFRMEYFHKFSFGSDLIKGLFEDLFFWNNSLFSNFVKNKTLILVFVNIS